ncbi:hypothetical protein [Streptomyces sp. NPDC001222]
MNLGDLEAAASEHRRSSDGGTNDHLALAQQRTMRCAASRWK